MNFSVGFSKPRLESVQSLLLFYRIRYFLLGLVFVRSTGEEGIPGVFSFDQILYRPSDLILFSSFSETW